MTTMPVRTRMTTLQQIDYILANRKMLQLNRFHHTNVITTFQVDGCSDHYPIEATFMSDTTPGATQYFNRFIL